MRVLVFRAPEAAAKTAASLAAAGHVAILAPVTTIVAQPVEWPKGRFDAILATSTNGFATRPSHEALLRLPVFVVGRTTAEAARAAGFNDTRIAAGDAASLLTLLRLTRPGPARLLYLAGQDRKPETEALLAEAGYTVDTLVVYAAEAVFSWPPEAIEALRDGAADAALHFSRRAAGLALSLAAHHGVLPAFLDLMQCCLSQDVAVPLREAGARSLHVAPRPEEAALLERLPTGPA